MAISNKGAITLPKAVLQNRRWKVGMRPMIDDTTEGALLKTAPPFAPTDPKDVFGSLETRGKPKTPKEVKFGTEVRRS